MNDKDLMLAMAMYIAYGKTTDFKSNVNPVYIIARTSLPIINNHTENIKIP